MTSAVRRLSLSLLLFILQIADTAPAHADDNPVYFLAIGSSRYLTPAKDDDHGFEYLSGARNGANEIAVRLHAGGAKFGIALTSPEGTVVGKVDIDKAIEAILSRIERDRTAGASPLLVVYIAAHGISEGVLVTAVQKVPLSNSLKLFI